MTCHRAAGNAKRSYNTCKTTVQMVTRDEQFQDVGMGWEGGVWNSKVPYFHQSPSSYFMHGMNLILSTKN